MGAMQFRRTRPDQRADRGTARRKGRPSGLRGLAAHPAFVPLLAAWGAALAGLSILVLPVSASARIAILTGLSGSEHLAHYLLSGIAALAAGSLAFGIARGLSQAARKCREIPIAADVGLRPLHPVSDLGTESFDAPIETMPLGMAAEDWLDKPAGTQPAGEAEQPERHGSAIRRRLARVLSEAEAASAPQEPTPEPVPELEPEPEPEPALEPREEAVECDEAVLEDPPLELDLAEFGALPGRNAVWVEAPLPEDAAPPEPQPAPEPEAKPTAARRQPAATRRLRETPAEELSLMQMVERLAAALHERQAEDHSDPRRGANEAGSATGDRDAALAEALKALGMLAGDTDGNEPHDSRGLSETGGTGELRAALAKLHDMRGAA